jgi:hypothetical protein
VEEAELMEELSMTMLRLVRDDDDEIFDEPLRFPVEQVRGGQASSDGEKPRAAEGSAGESSRLPHPPQDMVDDTELFEAIENISRRMNDLVRELDVLGRFDDDDDRPRAA